MAFLLLLTSAIFVVSAVDGIFAVASFPADPDVPIAGIFTYCVETCEYICHRTLGLRLWNWSLFLLLNYRTIKYWTGKFEKPSDYQISDQGHSLSDYRISNSPKTMGCPPLGLPTTAVHQQLLIHQQQLEAKNSREPTMARKPTTAGSPTTAGTAMNIENTSSRRDLNCSREGSNSRYSSYCRDIWDKQHL